jgi:prepilin-type N-terminal cleavage/methylation domain-containing protein
MNRRERDASQAKRAASGARSEPQASGAVPAKLGFTLIEVLAVVLMTGVLMGVALDFYLDLSRASNRASDNTRGTRRTAAVLDRMVGDLENVAFLHKPDALDPLVHPWIFYADGGSPQLGAERIKFVTRGHDARRSAVPESDLAVVTYALRRSEDGETLELWRSETPGLPDGLDRSFPPRGSSSESLLTEGVAVFGIAFRDQALQLKTAWDSSSLVEESELPSAVEIRLAMAEPDQPPENLVIQHRWVRLPIRPIDLEAMFKAGAEEDEEKKDKTVCDCIDCKALAASPSGARLVEQIGQKPFAVGIKMLPRSLRGDVDPECL